MALLSVVEDKIRAEPHVFTEFVKILESEPTLRIQARELVKKYHHFGKKILAIFKYTHHRPGNFLRGTNCDVYSF